jgi:hypothetical protein
MRPEPAASGRAALEVSAGGAIRMPEDPPAKTVRVVPSESSSPLSSSSMALHVHAVARASSRTPPTMTLGERSAAKPPERAVRGRSGGIREPALAVERVYEARVICS